MIAELASEIRDRFSEFQDIRIKFRSAHSFEGRKIDVSMLQFLSDGKKINVVSLELSDRQGHSASQDVIMESAENFKDKLMKKSFEDDLVTCLSTLNEALEEMD